MQMAIEDGRRMSDEYQRSLPKIHPPATLQVAERQDLSAFLILQEPGALHSCKERRRYHRGLELPHKWGVRHRLGRIGS